MLEKALNCFIPQGLKKEKKYVPEFVEKKLTANKLYASCLKEKDKGH